VEEGQTFALESTLSGRAYIDLCRSAKERGYRITLYFISLSSVDLTLERIAFRVQRGGHNVSESLVRRRFERSFNNFFTMYRPLADSWEMYDNSSSAYEFVAREINNELNVGNAVVYDRLFREYGQA
jgi:predicted ABC-type ATPase